MRTIAFNDYFSPIGISSVITNIIQIHSEDFLAKRAIYDVLNRNHDGRIRQEVLDFWRQGCSRFISHERGGDVIFLVALSEDGIVGLSCAAILRDSRRCFNSLTVVSRNSARQGIGTNLLKAKVALLKIRYPKSSLLSHVSKTNEPSIKMCTSSGLNIIGEGIRERDGKEPTEFYVLSSGPELGNDARHCIT